MIESVLGWLNRPAAVAADPRDELQLALAPLLIEAACGDDRFEESERAVVAQLLERRFNVAEGAARVLPAVGEREAERSAELFHLARTINERFVAPAADRAVLWDVAYADGMLDQNEDSLLRRIGGVVCVSDRERGAARQRMIGP